MNSTLPFSLIVQALPISPADVEKIAASDMKGILVWTAYVAFGTMFSSLCALAWAYYRSQQAVREVQDKSTAMLLEFSRTMVTQMEAMRAIPGIIERHERTMADARNKHEESIETLVREMREELRRILPTSRQR